MALVDSRQQTQETEEVEEEVEEEVHEVEVLQSALSAKHSEAPNSAAVQKQNKKFARQRRR